MKLETQEQIRSFQKAIRQVRESTEHPHTYINKGKYHNLKWIWENAKNPADAKCWFKVELGW